MADSESNDVTVSIASPYSISNITYIPGSLEVSQGSSHDDSPQITKSNSDGTEWTITLNSDRNGTAPIATDYNNLSGGSQHELSNGLDFDSSPEALNFFFGVNMTVDVIGGTKTNTDYLGQGHNWASRNNWWFGSNALQFATLPPPPYGPAGIAPQVIVNSAKFQLGGGVSSFELDPWPTHG